MERKQVTVKGCYNCKYKELKFDAYPCLDCSLSEVGAQGQVRWEERTEYIGQVGGDHYCTKEIQPWDIIKCWGLGFWRGNVIKYVLRAPDKGGKEDLEKAKHYLEFLIENYETIDIKSM